MLAKTKEPNGEYDPGYFTSPRGTRFPDDGENGSPSEPLLRDSGGIDF